MADTYVLVCVKVEDRAYTDLDELNSPRNQDRGPQGLINLLSRIDGGTSRAKVGYVVFDDQGTAADGTIACTQANAAGNYVEWEIGGQTVRLTEGTDFDAGASDTTCGANLAAAMNADRTLSTFGTAAAVTGTVTYTYDLGPTQAAHDIDMTTDDATAFGLTQIGAGTAADPGSAAQAWKGFDKT